MASINGIEIKNIKFGKDHMNCRMARGTVYLNNKKLGGWSQDPWGGTGLYEFDKNVLQEATHRYRMSDMVEPAIVMDFDVDDMLNEIVNLKDDEAMYNKAVKKGYNAYMTIDNYIVKKGYAMSGTRDEIKKSKEFRNHIKEFEIEEKEPFREFIRSIGLDETNEKMQLRIKIYTNPNDFIVNYL